MLQTTYAPTLLQQLEMPGLVELIPMIEFYVQFMIAVLLVLTWSAFPKVTGD